MVKKLLEERNVPKLLCRHEMLNILLEEEYGYLPPEPEKISWKVEENCILNFCAGKATADKVTAVCGINGKEFSFPFYVCIPTCEGKHPFFIHCQHICAIIKIRVCMRIVVSLTAEMIVSACKRKL